MISGRARGLALLAGGLLLALLAACAPRETPVVRGNREQILHRGIGHDLADLDPALATQASDYSVLSALFEGLVAEDPVDLHPVPGAAESWDVSPDRTVYTFHLRKDAHWSNNEPVTAQDFIAAWERALSPTLAADYANFLYVIQGAEAYNKQLAPFAQVGLAAPDASTLRVTLEHPTPYFLSLLTLPVFYPVNVHAIARYGDIASRSTPWARPERLVGNGPFELVAWHTGQEIVVRKSYTYWDRATVVLHEIHFHAIDSLDTEERAFRAGQLHVTEALPPGKLDTYRNDNAAAFRIDPLLGTEFFRINTSRPILGDVRIRRALSLAIDRTAIAEKILRGGQQPATGLVPPYTAGYIATTQLATDPAAARQLLIEAGYPGGKGLPPFELLFNNSESHRLVAEAVQEMWHRELGLEVRLLNADRKSTLDARKTGNFQIMRDVWIADYVDPASFLNIMLSDSGNNYTGWKNADYDAALFAAARETDPAARRALYQKAEGLLLEALPIVPLYHYQHVFLIQPSVQGWHPTVLDHHPYKYVRLAP